MNLTPIAFVDSIKRGGSPRIPPGASMRSETNGMKTLELCRGTSDLHRRIFGRIASMDVKQKYGPATTTTPCLIQVMIKIPFGANGSEAASDHSWAKVLGYASGMIPRQHDRYISDPKKCLVVGDAVEGFIHPTPSEEYGHASLLVWWPSSSDQWSRDNPASFFTSDLVPYSSDTWWHLPQLGSYGFLNSGIKAHQIMATLNFPHILKSDYILWKHEHIPIPRHPAHNQIDMEALGFTFSDQYDDTAEQMKGKSNRDMMRADRYNARMGKRGPPPPPPIVEDPAETDLDRELDAWMAEDQEEEKEDESPVDLDRCPSRDSDLGMWHAPKGKGPFSDAGGNYSVRSAGKPSVHLPSPSDHPPKAAPPRLSASERGSVISRQTQAWRDLHSARSSSDRGKGYTSHNKGKPLAYVNLRKSDGLPRRYIRIKGAPSAIRARIEVLCNTTSEDPLIHRYINDEDNSSTWFAKEGISIPGFSYQAEQDGVGSFYLQDAVE